MMSLRVGRSGPPMMNASPSALSAWREQEGIDQVVDVEQVVAGGARSDQHHAFLVRELEQLQEPCVAGAVDLGRAHHGDRWAAVAAVLSASASPAALVSS